MKGSVRQEFFWEGEREKFIKYVKVEMNTIQDTEKYMSGVLNNLLRTNCLNNFMKENQFFQESSVSKTREFKVYSNREEFINDFATGKNSFGCFNQITT